MLNTTAAFSYASAALAFLLLCLFLLTSWRSRQHVRVLALASLLSVIWGGIIALYTAQLIPPTMASFAIDLVELARNGAWTIALLSLLGHLTPQGEGSERRRRFARAIGAGYALLVACALLLPWLSAPLMFYLTVVGRVGLAVLGMLLVEQLYRNRPPTERWAIKFACLGIGGIFVYDFYMYSDTLLFRELNVELWSARGLVNALTVPLIAISVSRSASWASPIAVSRRMLFHSATLIGAAIYLLAMSFAGYYLRFVGGMWGSLMQLAFLFGASILLVGILFSGSFRASLKVFLAKHFYRYNYDYREEWMQFTRTLSEQGQDVGERSIGAMASLVDSPAGALWIRRDAGQFEPAAHWHMPLPDKAEAADSAFIQFMEQKQWLVDLEEHRQHPELFGSVPLPAWLDAYPRARLILPLMLHGRLFGFVLLLQPRGAIRLNWEVIDLLKIAGSQAASYLAQQEAAGALMLARQFDSFNRMSTFVVHDLKNLVAQLSLMMANAEKHRNNPEFQRDMQDTVAYSVQKMKLLLQKLSRSASPQRPAPLSVEQVLTQAVALKAAFEPKPQLEIGQSGLRVLADGERLERVVGHLIQNAIEATPKDGKVVVRAASDGDEVLIEISDTGQGMSEDFIRERLFKPFDSTKSAGMGIGAFESREYIYELGGRLEVSSLPLHGTTFKVRLPVYRQSAQTVEQAA
ncbi:XrtA/PEP-CTERM system histidine kinase PrsK [Massilia sp. BJB1822]|uniref:XrtA/PEP-CTERM system histidine kinase PrsK n=1 Tax=Massilia sp. BJB1822 TaxID=2744470 RepID=UPI001593E03E|nr:XrtA/PEP-CTERM system histidine kinase PrsK [Massilia sp. BJB1822]NVD96908.1 PEP-CTERM system histidine kinase PrsK [Massilia sp. BJB1822]